MASITRVNQFSQIICKNAEVVERYLEAKKLPALSLDADALWSIPISDDAVEVKEARTAVIEACVRRASSFDDRPQRFVAFLCE
jgi:hypothetical protein